jgi:hypothetical protein
MQAPKSKTNSCHVIPLTCLGIISQRCSANPPSEAIPATVRHYVGKASVSSVTLCHPLSYGRRTTPLKKDVGTLEKGTNACSALARDDTVTLDQ